MDVAKELSLFKEHLCLLNQPLSAHASHAHDVADAGKRKVYRADEKRMACGE